MLISKIDCNLLHHDSNIWRRNTQENFSSVIIWMECVTFCDNVDKMRWIHIIFNEYVGDLRCGNKSTNHYGIMASHRPPFPPNLHTLVSSLLKNEWHGSRKWWENPQEMDGTSESNQFLPLTTQKNHTQNPFILNILNINLENAWRFRYFFIWQSWMFMRKLIWFCYSRVFF